MLLYGNPTLHQSMSMNLSSVQELLKLFNKNVGADHRATEII